MKKANIIILISIIITILSLLSISIYLYLNPKTMYKNDENIVFFGDSITSEFDVEKYFPKNNVINSGISANKTDDLLERISSDVYVYNPSIVFILIGVNDLNSGYEEDDICLKIQSIINGIKINRPYAKIYVQSIYPINKKYIEENNYKYAENFDNENIISLNKKIIEICKESEVSYINLYDQLVDKDGNLKVLYTKEGLHLNNLGYLKVTSILKEIINEK